MRESCAGPTSDVKLNMKLVQRMTARVSYVSSAGPWNNILLDCTQMIGERDCSCHQLFLDFLYRHVIEILGVLFFQFQYHQFQLVDGNSRQRRTGKA